MEVILPERLASLTLGTAQIGMPYGVANGSAWPDEAGSLEILDAAWSQGVTALDTAESYGDAEARIGRWFAEVGHKPLIVSKFPRLPAGGAADVAASLEASLARSHQALGGWGPHFYLAHHAPDIFRPGAADTLRRLVDDGALRAFGVSVYSPQEAEAALEVPGLSALQAPLSVFDWRLARSGLLDRCRDGGVAVFARSVYLQGLLFLDPSDLPDHLAPARRILSRMRVLAAETGRSLESLALVPVRDLPGVASIVFGAANAEQVAATVTALDALPLPAKALQEIVTLAADLPSHVIDPRQWPARGSG